MCVCICMCACLYACVVWEGVRVRAWVRGCVRACVRVSRQMRRLVLERLQDPDYLNRFISALSVVQVQGTHSPHMLTTGKGEGEGPRSPSTTTNTAISQSLFQNLPLSASPASAATHIHPAAPFPIRMPRPPVHRMRGQHPTAAAAAAAVGPPAHVRREQRAGPRARTHTPAFKFAVPPLGRPGHAAGPPLCAAVCGLKRGLGVQLSVGFRGALMSGFALRARAYTCMHTFARARAPAQAYTRALSLSL